MVKFILEDRILLFLLHNKYPIEAHFWLIFILEDRS